MDRIETSERDLIRRCLGGDSGAWDEFVRRYVRLVAYVVRDTLRRSGRESEEDVDDVTEEIYAHLVDQDYRVLRNLREPYNLKAWLAVVARRKARDHARRRTLAPVSLDQPAAGGLRSAPLERMLGFRVDPASEEGEEVRRAVEAAPLNARERLMVSLYFFKEKAYAEVAAVMGVPENSIGPTIRRALDKVRSALQKRGW
jgi:RNA polymerase sigma-70 factor (ECF subfamily)